MASSTERSKRFIAAREAEGLERVVLWLPSTAVADFQAAAKRIAANRDLDFGPLRNSATGKLEKLINGTANS